MSKFINNKYFNLYSKIIRNAQAQKRNFDTHTHERHHIIPECMGGRQTVILTFREHFICHLLLTKFTAGVNKAKMYFALQTFFYFDGRRNLSLQQRSRLYENYKKAFVEAAKERWRFQKKTSAKPEVFTIRHKDTLEEFAGTRLEIKQYTGMTSQQLNYLLANPGITRHCLKWGIYDDAVGMFSTDIPRPRQSHPRRICPHCNKSVVTANYNRWHGDKCKLVDPVGHQTRSAFTSSLAASRVVPTPSSSVF